MESGEAAAWVSAGATFAAVLAALGIAWWDRLKAKQDRQENEREAARRWELDLLLRATLLTLQAGAPQDAPPEVRAREKERAGELLGLLWALGGPERFPVALHAGEREVETPDDLRRKVASAHEPWFIRREAEVTLAMLQAANAQLAATGSASSAHTPRAR